MIRVALAFFVRMIGHNHFSTAMHFNTGDELLGREILEFIRLAR